MNKTKILLIIVFVVVLNTSSRSFSMNLLKNVANFFGLCSFGMNRNNTQQRDSGIVKKKALVTAIENGDVDTVKKFTEDKTFDINKRIESGWYGGWTYLALACRYGNEKNVELLIKADAIKDINEPIEDGIYKGLTPLTLACCYCNEKTVELLLKTDAIKDINEPIEDGMYKGLTPLALACYYHYNEKVLELLLKTDAIKNINKPIEYGEHKGWTPLAVACCYGNGKNVELLIKTDAIKDINKPIEDGEFKGWTPLAVACRYGNEKNVELLIKTDAIKDISEPIGYGKFKSWTPLHIVCYRHCGKVLELLLKTDAIKDINKPIEDGEFKGWTPLAVACRYGNKETVELLLEHGANIDEHSKKSIREARRKPSSRINDIIKLVSEHDDNKKPKADKLDFILKQQNNDKDNDNFKFLVRINFGRLINGFNIFNFVHITSKLPDHFYSNAQIQNSFFVELAKNPVVKKRLKDIFNLKCSEGNIEEFDIEKLVFEISKKDSFWLKEDSWMILKNLNLLKNSRGFKKWEDVKFEYLS